MTDGPSCDQNLRLEREHNQTSALWPDSGLGYVVRAADCQITCRCGRESGCICCVSSRTWFRAEIAVAGAGGKTGAFDEPGRVRRLARDLEPSR